MPINRDRCLTLRSADAALADLTEEVPDPGPGRGNGGPQGIPSGDRHEEYFCDPYRPWQRDRNENTNGLLRQYFPKGEDVSGYTQAQLNAVARKLNTRPRETLDFRTPAAQLDQAKR